jgi:hypothetical protein
MFHLYRRKLTREAAVVISCLAFYLTLWANGYMRVARLYETRVVLGLSALRVEDVVSCRSSLFLFR